MQYMTIEYELACELLGPPKSGETSTVAPVAAASSRGRRFPSWAGVPSRCVAVVQDAFGFESRHFSASRGLRDLETATSASGWTATHF